MKRGQIDMQLLIVVGVLLAIGTIMVLSASAPTAISESGDAFQYLKKQLLMLFFGGIGMLLATLFNYKNYRKLAWPIFFGALVLLLLVFSPLGHEVNGAKRWILFAGFTLQPSEVMKFAIVILVSYKLSKINVKLENPKSYIVYAVLVIVIAGILQLQHHLSATVIIVLPIIILLLIAGMRKLYFALIGGVLVCGVGLLIAIEPFRLTRFFTFMNPLDPANTQENGWQIVNSLMAIGSGGWFGKGLGQSVQKFYLPEPQNDFIFAIFIEEMGLIGGLIVLMLFGYLIYRGYTIAYHAPDKFSAYMAIGITSIIAIQVIMNILVVISFMPVTGVSLPFFSYGGTSLIFLMIAMGILLNISRNSDTINKIKVSDETEKQE